MVRSASIAACLVALFAAIGVSSAHTEPAAETIPAAVDGAQEAVVWLRYRPAVPPKNVNDEDFVAERQKLIQRFKSPLVFVNALQQPGIADLETVRRVEDDPAAWLDAALEVTAPEGNDLIRVGLHGERADDLRQIVDAVTNAFITDVVERERTDLLARRDQLVKKYTEVQSEIRAKEEALAENAGPSGGLSTEIRRELLVGEIGSLRAQRTPLQIELLSIQADIAVAGTLGEQADSRKVARACILEKQITQLTSEMDSTLRRWSKAQADREAEEESIHRHRWILEELGRQLESTALDVTATPRVQRIEAPKSPQAP